jgi:D-cysteine desulfhydrase family pyridoxal phosphate-dependent enzyme
MMTVYTCPDIRKTLQKYSKKELIFTPTPLQKLSRLSQTLGGPEIYMKREDLTGLAFGGNKARKLEYILQDVVGKHADVIITWASLQSNWCLQTAAAARKFGILPILILVKSYDLPVECDGNLLLDFILSADIKIQEGVKGRVVREEDVESAIEEVVMEVKEWGHTPYIAPIGGSMVGGSMAHPWGAVGYVEAAVELKEQADYLGRSIDYIIHASGSGGTQAGLVTGGKALSQGKTQVLGISVSEPKASYAKDVLSLSRMTADHLELDLSIEEDDILVFDEYIREGYGVLMQEVSEALQLVAKEEGLFLDPVYTGKAMTGLLDLVQKGFFKKSDTVVFVHTGGTAALFPYRRDILSDLK